jgi:hypothetical protein
VYGFALKTFFVYMQTKAQSPIARKRSAPAQKRAKVEPKPVNPKPANPRADDLNLAPVSAAADFHLSSLPAEWSLRPPDRRSSRAAVTAARAAGHNSGNFVLRCILRIYISAVAAKNRVARFFFIK